MPRHRQRLSALAVLLVAGVLAAVGLMPAAASAAAVPYTDQNAIGYLGFCNAADQQITSGSITTQPFAVKAVSSTAAPQHYGPPYGRAVLYVYQPIQYVDPSDWSGKQMTAATIFTNVKAPMAIGTKLDPSLINFTSVFPLHVQGFAQVRMYFTASGQTEFGFHYPAANIQVTGNTWKQIGGGSVDCTAGKAYSNEFTLPGRGPSGSPSSGAHTPGASSSSGAGGTGSTGPGSGASSLSSSAAASQKKSSSSGSGVLWSVLAVVVVLALGGGGYVFWQRRRGGSRVSPEQ